MAHTQAAPITPRCQHGDTASLSRATVRRHELMMSSLSDSASHSRLLIMTFLPPFPTPLRVPAVARRAPDGSGAQYIGDRCTPPSMLSSPSIVFRVCAVARVLLE